MFGNLAIAGLKKFAVHLLQRFQDVTKVEAAEEYFKKYKNIPGTMLLQDYLSLI